MQLLWQFLQFFWGTLNQWGINFKLPYKTCQYGFFLIDSMYDNLKCHKVTHFTPDPFYPASPYSIYSSQHQILLVCFQVWIPNNIEEYLEQAQIIYCKTTLPWLGRGVFDSNTPLLRLQLSANRNYTIADPIL